MEKNEGYDELLCLSQTIFNSKTDSSEVVFFTEEYIEALKEYLKTNIDLKYIINNTGINIITETHNDIIFNLIVYDGNPIGYGSLEKTWTFLQIIDGNDIELYTLFAESAEYTLSFKVLELDCINRKFLIATAGNTNMSRSNTAYLSFWEYEKNHLEIFNDINCNSELVTIDIYDNECIIEFFDDEDIGSKIVVSEEECGLINIIGSYFELKSFINAETVFIEVDDY